MSLQTAHNIQKYRQTLHYQPWMAGFHCVKSVQIQIFSGPYFPVFGLNTTK